MPDSLTAGQADVYGEIADEYYDETRHPTSAALRRGSRSIIESRLGSLAPPGQLLEVGAGASILAELLPDSRVSDLTLVDASPAMLNHSTSWISRGARGVVANAEAMPFPASAFSAACASLGDPYNTVAFWKELARIVRRNGTVIFTTPSLEWARAYRASSADASDVAHFDLRHGGSADAPSFVSPPETQIRVLRQFGFRTVEVTSMLRSELEPVPPKISVLDPSAPVVTGYLLQRL